MKNTVNNTAMNTAISTILENIGNNPEAMKALMAALAETGKIAAETKTAEVKKSCRYIICLERMTARGNKVYHPFVMTPPTCEKPVMLIADNAVKAQDMAQRYGMMIRDNVYAMPATEQQIKKLLELLKACNKRIVDAVNTAVRAVGMVSANIDTDKLCAQYMDQMMKNCNYVIGSSMDENSGIIEKDVEVIHPQNVCNDDDDVDEYDEEYDEDDDDCPCDNCRDCPHHRCDN